MTSGVIVIITTLFAICFTLAILWGDNIINLFKPKHKQSSKQLVKELIECSNAKGDKYWEVLVNSKHTNIHWDSYADAEFCFKHIIKDTSYGYMYESIQEDIYYILYLDKCTIYVVPQYIDKEYPYEKLTPYPNKYIIFLHKDKNYRGTLEKCYNNIVASDYWETKTIMTSGAVQKELDEAISNKDIKQLKKLIKEYEDTVELGNAVSKSLMKILTVV